MTLVYFAAGFSFLIFFALILAIISRLNSLSEQIDRIISKISQAVSDEKELSSKLEHQAKTAEP
jgi:predicted PurR-regulated permease PerM